MIVPLNGLPDSPVFTIGAAYRRKDLHSKYGGQPQGGISTPAKHPTIFLFTGKSGEQYGYTDGFRPDGMFWYTGEGQRGDMELVRGNRAIAEHQQDDRELHLFEDAGKGLVRYLGRVQCLAYHAEVAPDADRQPRQALVFELNVLDELEGSAVELPAPSSSRTEKNLWKLPLEELRKRALEKPPKNEPPKARKAYVYRRSQSVKEYVLARAEGRCEGCEADAPFMTPEARPYLEAHHIRRIADGGLDHPRWVIALCPTCHRRVHHAVDGSEYNATLSERAGHLELG